MDLLGRRGCANSERVATSSKRRLIHSQWKSKRPIPRRTTVCLALRVPFNLPGFTLENKVLCAHFNMADVLQSNFHPCGAELEDILTLRPVKEKAVFAEVSKRTTELCSRMQRWELTLVLLICLEHMNGDKREFKFTFDWDSLSKNPKYIATTDGLEYVRCCSFDSKLIVRLRLLVFWVGMFTSFCAARRPIRCSIWWRKPLYSNSTCYNTWTNLLLNWGSRTARIWSSLRLRTTMERKWCVQSTLCLLCSYQLSIAFSHIRQILDVPHFPHLKEKSLDFFDLIVDTGRKERIARLKSVSKQVLSGRIFPVIFVNSSRSPRRLATRLIYKFLLSLRKHRSSSRSPQHNAMRWFCVCFLSYQRRSFWATPVQLMSFFPSYLSLFFSFLCWFVRHYRTFGTVWVWECHWSCTSWNRQDHHQRWGEPASALAYCRRRLHGGVLHWWSVRTEFLRLAPWLWGLSEATTAERCVSD